MRLWERPWPTVSKKLPNDKEERTPGDAEASLRVRLRDLSSLIRKEPAERARELIKYRDRALKMAPPKPDIHDATYTDRLFPYIHNEFLFNSARKVGPFAQISHLIFGPLYADRLSDNDAMRAPPSFRRDPFKQLDIGTEDTLNWLWKRAIHDNVEQRSGKSQRHDFRGGKDDIFEHVQELVDFSEPFITPKRYIYLAKNAVMDAAERAAAEETKDYDNYVERSGYSNIVSNTVEFLWRASGGRKGHFRWARHDRPYQTFTFTNEYAQTDDTTALVPLGSEEWTRSVLDAIAADKAADNFNPFSHSAMRDLKHDVFANVMGRYVHGANFIVLPLKLFLNCEIAPRYAPRSSDRTLLDCLMGLAPELGGRMPLERWRAWASAPDAEGLWDDEFQTLMRGIRETSGASEKFDSLVVAATRNFLIPHCFPVGEGDRFDAEFVGYKCMDSRGYVFADMRNRSYRMHGEDGGLFSRTVIIDCGLNKYERGRIIQSMTDFATERIMSLLWLARFRLVHHALNVVQTRVSLALSRYQSGAEQTEETLSQTYAYNVKPLGSRMHEPGLISALEFLSSCLSVLNEVVEGGIMDRANASSHSHSTIRHKVDALREEPLAGFQCLSEFMERRYARPIRTVWRVGERYDMLRRRISEIAELASVRMQARQSEEQERNTQTNMAITIIALVFGIIAITGPLGETIVGRAGTDASSWRMAVEIAMALGGLAGAYVLYRIWTLQRRRYYSWRPPQARRKRGP